uniref:Voltage-dependent anion-selective channel n=1 Tax=Parastrongyloides trichosuri TaxID=131310 RepID=A0A0N4ZXK2_PARTI
MAPPSFADLGKSAKDLFNKGYYVGHVKIDATHKTGYDKEYEFKTSATHDLATESLGANLDVKYKIPEYGATLTEKFSSKNTLTSVVEINDQFAKGLKVTFETAYGLKDASRTANIKTEFVKPTLKFNSNLSVLGTPILDSSAVLEAKDVLFGVQTIVDVGSSQLKSTNVTISKVTPQFATTAFMNNGSMYGMSIFQKASPTLDLGAQVNYKQTDGSVTYGLAAKYEAASDLVLRGKINNQSEIAVSATHKLNRELSLTATSQFSLLSSKNGQNKLGLGIEYSA